MRARKLAPFAFVGAKCNGGTVTLEVPRAGSIPVASTIMATIERYQSAERQPCWMLKYRAQEAP